MRLIDADALKVRIDKASNEWLEQGGLNGLDLAQQVIMLALIETVRNGFCGEIDKAPTAAEQNWVPCEERLPEKDGYHIVTFESDSGKRCATVANYMSEFKKWIVFGGKIVAWFSYPEPWDGKIATDANVLKIGKAPTAEWIPCSERNPDEEGEYIVTFTNDCFEGMKFVNTALWYPKWQKWGMYDNVLAWMPKPEPWKPNFEQQKGKEHEIG